MKNKPTIGVSLGAGAARAFSHIGVLQVLKENGIDADIITGCSMGAFIAGIYATGGDLYMLEKLFVQYSEKMFIDYTISKKGLIKGEKAETLIKLLTKNKNIEDAGIPFACVAVCLEDGGVKVFDKGPMYKAVRASISLPGIFVPYKIGKKHYVDGGIIERLPVRLTRDMGADFVIGVDVSYKGETQETPKNAMSVMAQVLNITSWEIAKNKIYDCDVLILPKVREIRAYANDECEKCLELGRSAAKTALPEIKEKLAAIEEKALNA